ncbi:hypothetical protein KL921_003789 [Ogataea angusta]|nr:hypothetical protein KL921_003789 [Ogataea angusta]
MTATEPQSPRYFTEYLPRLCSVSICVEVQRQGLEKLLIKDNHLLVSTKTQTISIPLAGKTADYDDILSFARVENGFITLKVPAVADKAANSTDQLTSTDDLIWSIRDLKQHPKGVFECAACCQPIADLSKIRKLHSMPSEMWYEMMEFWHCHKPTNGNYTNDKIANRFNSLKPASDTLIVGAYYFLAPSLPSIFTENQFVKCAGCHQILGEQENNNHKLLKWKLALRDRNAQQYCSCLIYLYSYLLDSIASTAVRFFLVKSQSTRVLLWCFNFGIDVTFSSSYLKNCLKVMYIDDESKVSKFLEQNDGEGTNQRSLHNRYEVVDLEDDMMTETINELNTISEKLPESQRQFNQWKVSYLGRRL